MQLKIIFFVFLMMGFPLLAQNPINPDNRQKTGTETVPSEINGAVEHREAEIDILLDYYNQDGDHTPVQGGQGTEKLTNVAPIFIVNVPLDTVSKLHVNFGVDYYTSASTNKIDQPYGSNINLTGASKQDVRVHFDGGYSRENRRNHTSWQAMAGVSSEFDVVSGSLSAQFNKGSSDENRQFSIGARVFFDQWQLIYPVELRDPIKQGEVLGLKDDLRQSFNLSLIYSFVINRKIQMALLADVVYQTGLLSTPFHRVYFKDQDPASVVDLERLPDSRFKLPLAVRMSYAINDWLMMRGYYRFYSDDWGIASNTVSLEFPIKLATFFTATPFYRFHKQSAADYFAPFRGHSFNDEYYSSDYDLSALTSHKVGLGFKYAPLSGLGSFKPIFDVGRKVKFRSIDLRASYYDRSDGLSAFNIAMGLGFLF